MPFFITLLTSLASLHRVCLIEDMAELILVSSALWLLLVAEERISIPFTTTAFVYKGPPLAKNLPMGVQLVPTGWTTLGRRVTDGHRQPKKEGWPGQQLGVFWP